MLKVAIAGLWAVIVTSAAAILSPGLIQGMSAESGHAELAPATELKTEMTSIPTIRDGQIVGYVIVQLSFMADSTRMGHGEPEPQPYLVDAAFRVIFSDDKTDFRRMRRSDIDRLTQAITAEANKRMGEGAIRDVLIQQLNFVRKEDIRTHWIKNQNVDH